MNYQYPSFQYDFSDFFNQTVVFWTGDSMNMAQFISMVIGVVLGILCYIFQAVALYTMAKQEGIKAPVLAWIPILSFYTLGKVADRVNLARGKKTALRNSLVTFNALLTAFSFGLLTYLPVIINFIIQFMFSYNIYQPHTSGGSYAPVEARLTLLIASLLIVVVAIIYLIFLMRAIYIIFRDRVPGKSGWMLVLCLFFNYAIGPCLFAIRKLPSQAVLQMNYQRQQMQAQADAMERYRREMAEQRARQEAEEARRQAEANAFVPEEPQHAPEVTPEPPVAAPEPQEKPENESDPFQDNNPFA